MALYPGAPTLPAAKGAVFAQFQLLAKDSILAKLGFGPPVWGIFDQSNTAVLLADNVIAFDYKKNWKIADYPIEQGGFSTYDKVTLPFDAKITFSRGGTETDRAKFLSALEYIGSSFQLYNIVTPERTYLNASVETFGYNRSATDGAGLITVDIGLKEIRQVATKTFTKTASPSAQNSANTGNQQPQAPTTSQQSAISNLK